MRTTLLWSRARFDLRPPQRVQDIYKIFSEKQTHFSSTECSIVYKNEKKPYSERHQTQDLRI